MFVLLTAPMGNDDMNLRSERNIANGTVQQGRYEIFT